MVALRKESVDRNVYIILQKTHIVVALRKESVDRNERFQIAVHCVSVALRKESVDRNTHYIANNKLFQGRSPQGERG